MPAWEKNAFGLLKLVHLCQSPPHAQLSSAPAMSGSQAYAVLEMEHDMELELDDGRRAGPSKLTEADTRGVSRSNKALAAITGAAVTSLMSA